MSSETEAREVRLAREAALEAQRLAGEARQRLLEAEARERQKAERAAAIAAHQDAVSGWFGSAAEALLTRELITAADWIALLEDADALLAELRRRAVPPDATDEERRSAGFWIERLFNPSALARVQLLLAPLRTR